MKLSVFHREGSEIRPLLSQTALRNFLDIYDFETNIIYFWARIYIFR